MIHATARKLQERLRERGLDADVRELADSTRTAADAAAAVGCEVGQIVKSLVFTVSGDPVVCLCAGDRRVDVSRLADDARAATADEVRAATGFAIGGVPPAGHVAPVETIVDEDLLGHDVVWAAAGRPDTNFAIAPAVLVEVTGGRVARVAS